MSLVSRDCNGILERIRLAFRYQRINNMLREFEDALVWRPECVCNGLPTISECRSLMVRQRIASILTFDNRCEVDTCLQTPGVLRSR